MSHEVFYQFPQKPGQARRSGARGGKATARHRRQSQNAAALAIAEPLVRQAREPLPFETTAAAIARLDAQFPWLRGVERRFLKRLPTARRGANHLCPEMFSRGPDDSSGSRASAK